MASRNSAVYVYCVVRAARRPPLTRLPGPVPGGTRPELTAVADDLFLVTSRVPLDVYGSPHLEARLRNLDWVAEAAVAHERLVEHFARRPGTTIVPMKMFTMFSSIEKALEDVRGKRREIGDAIRRIRGCEEWGIRITRPAAALSTPRGPRRRRTVQSPRSGTAFLTARKQAREAAQATRGATREAADRAFVKLRRLARAVRRRDDHHPPGVNPPILEAAFLVPATARGRFKAEAKRQAASCAALGAAMALSGPWPAYNFVNAAEERA